MLHYAQVLTPLIQTAAVSGVGRVMVILFLVGVAALAILNAVIYWQHMTRQLSDRHSGRLNVIDRPIILSGIALALVLIVITIL